jgi:hypothetical protein
MGGCDGGGGRKRKREKEWEIYINESGKGNIQQVSSSGTCSKPHNTGRYVVDMYTFIITCTRIHLIYYMITLYIICIFLYI